MLAVLLFLSMTAQGFGVFEEPGVQADATSPTNLSSSALSTSSGDHVYMNPLNIKTDGTRSNNYFLVVGDWGFGPGSNAYGHISQKCGMKVAAMMKNYAAKQQRLGKKLLFVGALGDNFYDQGLPPNGTVTGWAPDGWVGKNLWTETWEKVYGTNDASSSLNGIPWLAVMGNHDFGGRDTGCACGKGCNQFNGDHRPAGTAKYWIPDYYWSYYIPEVKLEILGLDTNNEDVGGLGGDGCANGAKASCELCGGGGVGGAGQSNIQAFLNGKYDAGHSMMKERASSSDAETVLIMQHYPDKGATLKNEFDKINNGKAKKVISAYGHAHDQQCQGTACEVILSGGGGGWAGGQYYGFIAVHLQDDGSAEVVVESDEVRFGQNDCDSQPPSAETLESSLHNLV